MRIVIPLLLVILAGCTDPPTDSPRESKAPTLPTLSGWTFSDCHGFDTIARYPLESGPGEAPPGWEWDPFAAGRYMTYVGYEAFHCDRVSLLGIERPATMIFETHSRFRPPANCTQGNWDHLAIVSKAFVDDADLAAALASIGFNAAYSTIEAVRSEVSHQWRWTFDNATWSKIEILRGTGATTPLSEIARLAVWGGNVLTLIDMAWLHSVPDFPALVATGELAPGTLYAGDESATYVGVGDVNLEASATGKIQYRGDPSCDGFAT